MSAEVPTRVSAAVIVMQRPEGPRVLLTQRLDDDFIGLWESPGGKNESGETDHDAVRREIREELGVEIEVGPKLGEFEFAGSSKIFVVSLYGSRITSGIPFPLQAKALGLFRAEEVEVLPLMPTNRALVVEVIRWVSAAAKWSWSVKLMVGDWLREAVGGVECSTCDATRADAAHCKRCGKHCGCGEWHYNDHAHCDGCAKELFQEEQKERTATSEEKAMGAKFYLCKRCGAGCRADAGVDTLRMFGFNPASDVHAEGRCGGEAYLSGQADADATFNEKFGVEGEGIGSAAPIKPGEN